MIILIHGLIRTFLSMKVLESKLKSAGHQTLNYNYASRRHDLKGQVELLTEFIETNSTNDEPIDFVTHSLGGIIARKYLTLSESRPVRRIVMLGPPNQGATIAKFLGKNSTINSALGGAFRELQSLDLPHGTDRAEIGIIAGGRGTRFGYNPFFGEDNDMIVQVSETHLAGQKDHILVPCLHSFLMYHPKAITQTKFFLEHGKFDH